MKERPSLLTISNQPGHVAGASHAVAQRSHPTRQLRRYRRVGVDERQLARGEYGTGVIEHVLVGVVGGAMGPVPVTVLDQVVKP